MKRTIFTAILIFAFCFTAFAQANENQSKAVKISEYWEDPSSENVKFAIHDLGLELLKDSRAEGVIIIQAKENKAIIRQLVKIKNLILFRKLDLNRISFAINKKNNEIIQYWFVPSGENTSVCEDCIIIRAEDYDKLIDFFNPKPKSKKRKK